MRIVEELSSFYRHIYLNLPGFTRLVGVTGAGAPLRFGVFPANLYKIGEPTSGLEPPTCSLRVITQALQGCAGGCKCRIYKRLSLLWLAGCCTVLRSRWCQSGVNSIYLLNSRYRASLQVVLQDAGCRIRRGTKHFYRNASASSHI